MRPELLPGGFHTSSDHQITHSGRGKRELSGSLLGATGSSLTGITVLRP